MAELISEPPGTQPIAAPQQRISPSVMSSLGVGNMGDMGPRYRAALDESGAAMQRVKGAETARESALQPLERQIKQAGQTAPTPPTLDKVPDKGYQHIGMSQEEMTKAMQTMFMFAAIGGAMTRQPMTAAMTAFAGGLNGLVKGDQIAFQRGQAEFDSNLKTAIAKNNEAVTEYKMAYEKHKGNLDNLMREWNLIARKHNDTVASANIQSNNAKSMLQHIENLAKADLQAKKLDVQMAETRRYHDAMMARYDADRATREAIAAAAAAAKTAATGNKPLNEGERKTGLFFNQMKSAEDEVSKITEGGFSSDQIGGQVGARMATSDWTNWLAPEAAQKYAQATEQWAEAYLRLKTGAATNRDEIRRNARTFFPQIGDEPGTVEQKGRMRLQAQEDVRRAAGRGAPGAATPAAGGGAAAPRSFASEAEAEAAGLDRGTRVIINGVSGTWR